MRAVACVWLRVNNRHLVIALFHTSVLISMDGINYHGDEQCGPSLCVPRNYRSASILQRDVAQNIAVAWNSTCWGRESVCIDFFLNMYLKPIVACVCDLEQVVVIVLFKKLTLIKFDNFQIKIKALLFLSNMKSPTVCYFTATRLRSCSPPWIIQRGSQRGQAGSGWKPCCW